VDKPALPLTGKIFMELNQTNNSDNATPLGNGRNDSASFRTVPQASETFGTIPQTSETFRSFPNVAERKENHTLTVREAARLFETAGVARTERSIINWCQVNAQGIARLDAYFDPNERKYFLTAQSVELAIAEEKAKAAKTNTSPSEPVGNVPKASERGEATARTSEPTDTEIKSMEHEIRDLQITNRAKDMFIERLEKEREAFATERQGYVEKLMSFNHRVGELETKLLQLAEPRETEPRKLEVRQETESNPNRSFNQ
jgi:hypothetical protein